MKKMQAPNPIATMGLSNTAAVVLSDIDDYGENVKYYVSTTGNGGMVELHTARVYYRASDGAPCFRSVVGRLSLNDFMKY